MDSSERSSASTVPALARRVLVLQGGGALGSYQAGAYQALCHFDFEPEWVAGISIGAVNAAIIAGNAPEMRVERLKEFWQMVSAPVPWSPLAKGDRERAFFNETSAALIAAFGVPGFFIPRFPPAPLWPQGSPQSQSYYDTTPLRATLERLVDFDRINDLKTRLSVGAVGVTSGNFTYFDNVTFKKQGKKIGPEHIMASGALPPGFPAIEIDGEHYWDGGIASNTPLDYVLDEDTSEDRPDLPGRSVQRPRIAAGDAAGGRGARKGHPLFQPDPDEYRQEQAGPQRPQGAARPDRQTAGRIEKRPVGGDPEPGGQGKHRHGGAPDLPQQELRSRLPRITIFPMSAWSSTGTRDPATCICRCATRSGWSGRRTAKPW